MVSMTMSRSMGRSRRLAHARVAPSIDRLACLPSRITDCPKVKTASVIRDLCIWITQACRCPRVVPPQIDKHAVDPRAS